MKAAQCHHDEPNSSPRQDLLDHEAIRPFLAALIPSTDGLGTRGGGIRLDRLYGIHQARPSAPCVLSLSPLSLSLSLAQDRKSSGILPTGSGLGGFHRDFEGTYGVRNGVFDNSFIVVAFAVRQGSQFCKASKMADSACATAERLWRRQRRLRLLPRLS